MGSGGWPTDGERSLAADPRTLALALLAGVLSIQLSAALPPLWTFLPPLAICLLRFPGRGLFAVALAGAAYTTVHATALEGERLPPAHHGDTRWVTGHVEGLPEVTALRTRFKFVSEARPRRIRTSWYGDVPALRPGQCWRLELTLRAPRGSFNPGGFDYEAWLWRQRIGATGYVRAARPCAAHRPAPLSHWRDWAARRLAALLDGHAMTGPIQALGLGVRMEMDDAQWQVLRRTGTSHLVAISGLHVGLVAAVVFLGARRGLPWLYVRSRPAPLSLAAAAAALAAAGYALLSGFALPAQRALVMVLVVLVAVWSRRRTAPSRLLALAAIAVLVLDPFAPMSPGFWLSFGAVAWILYLVTGRSRPGRWAWLRLQPALAVGLLPITLFWFGEASLVAAFANAILIPLFAVLVPVLLCVLIAALTWPALGGPLLRGLAEAFDGGWSLLAWSAELPYAYVTLPVPTVPVLIAAVLGVAWLLAPPGAPGRWLGLLGLAPLLVGPAPPPDGGFRLTLLDVGQGLAAVVRTAEHTLLFDAGPRYRTGFDTGEAIVLPYLRAQGIRRLDTLLVSHGDIDHRGGVEAVSAGMPVVRSVGVGRSRPCQAGQSWRWDGVSFRILHPPRGDWSGNNASCVLSVSGAGGRLLLTGDIEAEAERDLVGTAAPALAADALVVAHHGSDSSSTAPFLRAVAPRHALVPAGWRNRWGFPASAVTARLRAVGARVHRTGEAGALSMDFDPATGAGAPRSWRAESGRYWHGFGAVP